MLSHHHTPLPLIAQQLRQQMQSPGGHTQLSRRLWLAGQAALGSSSLLPPARAADATDTILDFAEAQFPAYFPGRVSTQNQEVSGGTLRLRHYPSTGNALGVWQEAVYALGPVTGGSLLRLGSVAELLVLAQAPAASCAPTPVETAGPFPGDGTNTSVNGVANALALAGIVRSDIRQTLPSGNTATGVPLTLRLLLRNTNAACASPEGFAVYAWHCDALGRYSLYESGVTQENYLRGVQVASSAGLVVFQTVFPGCYAGRWPHIHFEVFRSVAQATSGANDILTSQLALPVEACQAVYGTGGYGNSASNLSRLSLASDGIFADGVSRQLVSLTGSVASGYVATLAVGVAG